MLTPEYIQSLPNNLAKAFKDLELQIIRDISNEINSSLRLTEKADYQIKQLYELGYNLDDIEKEIAKATSRSTKDVEKLLKESSYLSYENDKGLYKAGGKNLPRMSSKMEDFIIANIINCQDDLKNLTKTMGVALNGKHKNLSLFYRDTLNEAVIKLGSGAYSYDDVIKQAVKPLIDNGIRTIDYSSGISNHVDVAVRRSILTTSSKITGYMSEMNADEMDQDIMEITSHWGSRPSHAEWQGQLVSRSGKSGYLSLEDIGYETGEGFKGWNCRHDWFPFFVGISEPAKYEEEPGPFEYGGREYSYYEATQYQRSIERKMRKTQREISAYKGAGLEQDEQSSRIKLTRQESLYKDFSKKANIRAKWERTQIIK